MARKVEVSALELSNRLQSMIKKALAGNTNAELKDTISRLAAKMRLTNVKIPADLDEVSKKRAGEIGGSSIVQDPAWRNTVEAAKRQRKRK